MRDYMIRLVDGDDNLISLVPYSGYGPSHALDEAISSGAVCVPVGFIGWAHVVNSLSIAYKFEIGFAA